MFCPSHYDLGHADRIGAQKVLFKAVLYEGVQATIELRIVLTDLKILNFEIFMAPKTLEIIRMRVATLRERTKNLFTLMHSLQDFLNLPIHYNQLQNREVKPHDIV